MSLNIFRIVLLFVAVTLSTPATAQAVGPDPINDVTRYKVYFYKFGPGGKDLARQMIWDHILPAMRKAGVPEPLVLHPEDGEWDMISLYPLPGGYTDLHWQHVAIRVKLSESWCRSCSSLSCARLA